MAFFYELQSDTYSENDRLANNNELLRRELEQRSEELQRLQRELEESRTTYEEEIRNLKGRNDLLQLQLQREELDHEQDVDMYEERLSGRKIMRTKQRLSEDAFDDYQDSREEEETDKREELAAQLEETVKKNQMLTEELAASKQELECLKCVGKEHGALKAENMKLKTQISTLEKQMNASKDIEENLRKTKQLNEELNVKVQYLEKQLAITRSRMSEKIPPKQANPLTSIKEEEATSKVALQSKSTTRPPCSCDEKKYKISTNLTVLYDNRKFTKACNTDSDSTVEMSEHTSSYCSNRFARVQMHIASMNQMENKVAQMILSVRQQNQRSIYDEIQKGISNDDNFPFYRASECNASRIRNEKDMESRLHMLKHKRERLMLSLDNFRKEMQGK